MSALKKPAAQEKYSIALTDSQGFELAQRAAKMLASSSLVPKEYQGNVANCVIALNMSYRLAADPIMVMQNLVIVHGRPTWSSQFLISTVNTCGRFTALRYEFFGEKGTDGWGCRAWAIEKATGEKLVGTDITIGMAKDEGWYNRNGSKWKTMPQQMLMYRAGSWWARAYAPELSMGLHTAEEAQDIIDVNPDGTYTVSQQAFSTDDLRKTPVKPAEVVDEAGIEVCSHTQYRMQPAPEEEKKAEEKPAFTFAEVNDRLIKSKTVADLDEAASLISLVPNPAHQEELRKVYAGLKQPE